MAGRVDPRNGSLIGPGPLGWEGQNINATFKNLLQIPFITEGRAAAQLQLDHSRAAQSI